MAEVEEKYMQLLKNEIYVNTIKNVAELPMHWESLRHSRVMISGATGMIGHFLIDVLMYKNVQEQLDCKVIALGRDEKKAQQKFGLYWENKNFQFVCCDINQEIPVLEEEITYLFHLASNTHPVAYAADPIGTVTANIIGTYNLLNFAAEHAVKRFIFASSVEIYGENRGDTEKFSEDYMGYIDCNTLRAGYPESKRAGEALCQAFIKQKGLDIVMPRLSRTFGPTMLMSDSKAISQFIKKGAAEEDIVLKSSGTQFYSYSYVADAVSAILTCLFEGKNGEAYNVADDSCNISLRDLAGIIADYAGTSVVFEIPDTVESEGYSKATKAVLDSSKLQEMGWAAQYTMQEGLEETITILRNME